ncbi:hypothetical protein K2X40_03295 [Candidatus Babeliales bacterium]|nr:hypothetical protein [Candidatus Babeliales bacterium]
MKKIITLIFFAWANLLVGSAGIPPAHYKPNPVGIYNYQGNSCFMNASIQTLYHIPQLTSYLFSQTFANQLRGNENTVAGKYVEFIRQLLNSHTALPLENSQNFRDYITCKPIQSLGLFSTILSAIKQQIEQKKADCFNSTIIEKLRTLKENLEQEERNANNPDTKKALITTASLPKDINDLIALINFCKSYQSFEQLPLFPAILNGLRGSIHAPIIFPAENIALISGISKDEVDTCMQFSIPIINFYQECKRVKKNPGSPRTNIELPDDTTYHAYQALESKLRAAFTAAKNFIPKNYTDAHPYPSLIPFATNQQDADEFVMPLVDSFLTVDQPNTNVSHLLQIGYQQVLEHPHQNPRHTSDPKHSVDNKLIVPIPKNTQSNQQFSLKSLLDTLFTPESNVEWQCNTCNMNVMATKGDFLDATKIPTILTIQLSRFASDYVIDDDGNPSFDSSGNLVQESFKIYNPVSLDQDLVLKSSYFAQPNTPDVHYKIVGFVMHIGAFGGGHYTAFVLNPGDNNWWYCDDSRTSIANTEIDPVTKETLIEKVLRLSLYPHNIENFYLRGNKVEHPTEALDIPKDRSRERNQHIANRENLITDFTKRLTFASLQAALTGLKTKLAQLGYQLNRLARNKKIKDLPNTANKAPLANYQKLRTQYEQIKDIEKYRKQVNQDYADIPPGFYYPTNIFTPYILFYQKVD